jgi:signal transduction histidine kinase/ligand-binding sensor domain-containing protein
MVRLCWASVFLALCWLGSMPAAAALSLDVDIHQLHHTSWTIGDGAPPDIWALAQGPDGFLWLATGAGLYRFDGVTFERFQPGNGQALQSLDLNGLSISPSGDLWVGYLSAGVTRIANGQVTNFTEKDGIPVGHVWSIETGRGDTWVASEHGLFRYHRQHWEKIGRDWDFPYDRADFLLSARDGTLWVASQSLLFLKPGATKFQTAISSIGPYSVPVEDNAGRIWVSDTVSGIYPVNEAKRATAAANNLRPEDFVHAGKVKFDRDGILWGTDEHRGGVFRVRSPQTAHYPVLRTDITETFDHTDGLTTNNVVPILEDREGDIWVGSELGLNRFSPNKFQIAEGIPANARLGYNITRDGNGDVLIIAANALYRIKDQNPPQLIANTLPVYNSILTDHKGRVWIAGVDAHNKRFFGQFTNDRLLRFNIPENEPDLSTSILRDTGSSILAEDADGGILVGVGPTKLLKFKDGAWSPYSDALGIPRLPYTVALTDKLGRVWIGFRSGAVALVDHGNSRLLTAKDGLSIGSVTAITEIDGRVLFGGEFGLAEYTGKAIKSITTQRFSGFGGITGIVQSSDGDIWTNGSLGIVRISHRDLEMAFRDDQHRFRYKLFDYRDGVTGVAEQAVWQQTAIARRDGTLWFVTNQGLVTTDPTHFTLNKMPPPVSILSITANGQTRPSDNQILPPGIKDLRIDYTALSLALPERVQFRYRLEGYSNGWIDPGRLRQAYFTNLPPGQYRFRVIASNNDGIWNTSGASISFLIPPTFTQSWAFLVLCLVGTVMVLWSVYAVRLKQMADHVRGRLEERIRERERIARELHDTLLQSVQGLALRFHAVAKKMNSNDPRRREIEFAIQRADEVLVDGRDRVRLLRNSDNRRDLITTLQKLVTELSADGSSKFHFITEGKSRKLHFVVHEELAWIGREALLNAFVHAKAEEIVAKITYHWSELRLQVRDDGVGLPNDVIRSGTREGHFGLIGIRERAKRIRSRVTVRSKSGAGTEMTVIVPAAVAYTDKKWFWDPWGVSRLFIEEVEL